MRASIAVASLLAAAGIPVAANAANSTYSECTDAQKSAALSCAGSALVGGVFSDNCATFRRQLECYGDGSCCVSATALKLRHDAIQANCTDLPVCAPSDCAAREIWEGIQPCVTAAIRDNFGSVCPTLDAATRCMPETCCKDELVQDLAATSVSYGCDQLYCADESIPNSGGVTPVDEAELCAALDEEQKEEVMQCLADVETAIEAEEEEAEEEEEIQTTTSTIASTETTTSTSPPMPEDEGADAETMVPAPTPAPTPPPTPAPMPEPAPSMTAKGSKTAKTKTKTKGTKRTTLTMQKFEEEEEASAEASSDLGRDGNSCAGLQKRMDCIPSCCCDSDSLAIEIRDKAQLLGCPALACGESVDCATDRGAFAKDGAKATAGTGRALALLLFGAAAAGTATGGLPMAAGGEL